MRRFVAVCLMLAAGCGPSYTYSETKTKPARVLRLIYTPIQPGDNAKFTVLFEDDYGTFVVSGDEYRTLWQSLHEGQSVTIRYREVQDPKTHRGVTTKFLGADPAH